MSDSNEQVKFPKLNSESSRGLGPTNLNNFDNRLLLKKSNKWISLQQNAKSLIDSQLSSKFFCKKTIIPDQAVSLSPKHVKHHSPNNSLLTREIARINENLLLKELSFKNSSINEQDFESQFWMYLDHLENLKNCYSFIHKDLYKSMHNALNKVSEIFLKIKKKLHISEKFKTGKILEKTEPLKLLKLHSSTLSQTDEKIDNSIPDINIESLKGLNEKMKNINIPRVTRRLVELNKSLANMYISSVPHTPSTPDINTEEIFSSLSKFQNITGKSIDLHNDFSQTEKNIEKTHFFVNSNLQPKENILLIENEGLEACKGSNKKKLKKEIVEWQEKFKSLEHEYFLINALYKHYNLKGIVPYTEIRT